MVPGPHLCKPCGNRKNYENMHLFRKKLYFCQKVGEDAHARQFASMLALLSLNRIFASSND